MKRRLVNLLTALSLALAFLACALWVRSYFELDLLQVAARGKEWTFQSRTGSVSVSVRRVSPRRAGTNYIRQDIDLQYERPEARLVQFEFHPAAGAVVPHWAIVTLAAILPVARFVRARRRRHATAARGFPVSDTTPPP